MANLSQSSRVRVKRCGVVVPWDWQTTAAKIANERERRRVNQKAYRDRDRAKKRAYERGVAEGKIRPIA